MSGAYLLNVINDILDMSKIEAGRLELSIEPVELGAMVNEAVRILQPNVSEKAIGVDNGLEEGLTLLADRRAIKQILLNLLANAVKFTPEGGRVAVSSRKREDGLELIISDTGIGIAREDIGRLGQAFVQVENQFTKTHKGSGLGLAIARSLLEMHEGQMSIQSQVGVGTTVTVFFPSKLLLTGEVARMGHEAAEAGQAVDEAGEIGAENTEDKPGKGA